MRKHLPAALGLLLLTTPTLAVADAKPKAPAPPSTAGSPGPAPVVANAQGVHRVGAPAAAAAPTSDGAPAATSDAPVEPKSPATGYGFDDKKPKTKARAARYTARPSGPVATLPGYETLPDGGSRLFVQLTQTVPVEERKAAGSITYVLKGAHLTHRNNANALVTVHFNTPVSRARLVGSGGDLLFVVDLRAAAAPVWKLETAQDNTAILRIDFPKGEYLQSVPQDDVVKSPRKRRK